MQNRLLTQIRRLPRATLPIDTVELARYLIGKTILRTVGQSRKAAGSSRRKRILRAIAVDIRIAGKRRNQTLFIGAGFAYVYFTYGTSYMLNVTAEEPGVGAGVLLRAIEPLQGITLMQQSRGTGNIEIWREGPDDLRLRCR